MSSSSSEIDRTLTRINRIARFSERGVLASQNPWDSKFINGTKNGGSLPAFLDLADGGRRWMRPDLARDAWPKIILLQWHCNSVRKGSVIGWLLFGIGYSNLKKVIAVLCETTAPLSLIGNELVKQEVSVWRVTDNTISTAFLRQRCIDKPRAS